MDKCYNEIIVPSFKVITYSNFEWIMTGQDLEITQDPNSSDSHFLFVIFN